MSATTRRAIFCDRDGTLIRDLGYLREPGGVEILPGAVAALSEGIRRGFSVVVVSNQSGVARGLISLPEFEAVDQAFRQAFASQGIALAGVYYCLHGPDEGCNCRKPKTGMIDAAARDLDLDVRQSILFGDKESDVAAGRAAGCRTVLFGVDQAPAGGTIEADACVQSWDAAGRVLV